MQNHNIITIGSLLCHCPLWGFLFVYTPTLIIHFIYSSAFSRESMNSWFIYLLNPVWKWILIFKICTAGYEQAICTTICRLWHIGFVLGDKAKFKIWIMSKIMRRFTTNIDILIYTFDNVLALSWLITHDRIMCNNIHGYNTKGTSNHCKVYLIN